MEKPGKTDTTSAQSMSPPYFSTNLGKETNRERRSRPDAIVSAIQRT
jgi:hypothetical protein